MYTAPLSGRTGRPLLPSLCAAAVFLAALPSMSATEAALDNKTDDKAVALDAPKAGNIEDLAARFREDQSLFRRLMPPDSEHGLTQPCGLVVFDWKAFPEPFNKGLIGELEHDCPVYRVLIAEDPETREIVFANADGKEIYAVKPESGYDPYWLLTALYPDLYARGYGQDYVDDLLKSYDSARIEVVFQLLPSQYAAKYAAALAAERLAASSSGSGGGVLMRYSGPPVTNLVFGAIERQTNNILLTIVYPADYTNRLDLFATDDLIGFWWDRLATTNIDASTNWIEWLDTTTNASIRFYAAGNADLDTDGDGLTDAAEKYMYHTSATTNDTDGDTLTDYYEIMSLDTDPNNPKTNRPTAWISYPANESRKVWLP